MTPQRSIHALLIEDSPTDAEILCRNLRKLTSPCFDVTHVESLSEAEMQIDEAEPDVALVDLSLPDSDGIGTVRSVHALAPGVPIVVLTGLDDQNVGVEALGAGAQDYLVKGNFDSGALWRSVHYAIERNKLVRHLKRRTQELQTSRAQLRRVMEKMVDAVIIVDRDGAVRYANPAAVQLFDRDAEKLLNAKFGVPLMGRDKVEIQILRRDRRLVVAELRTADVEWEGTAAYLATLRDITERKQAEELLVRQAEDLGRVNTELERFTHTVSHDLKSPLITITSFLAELESDVAATNPDQFRADVAQIRRAADTMQQLIDQLLELSRIGRTTSDGEAVPLAEPAREAVDLLAGRIAERGVDVCIQPDLPAAFGDRLRLRQVFQNLIENAIKFMGDQPRPRIDIGGREEEGETLCFVRDNGAGIDPADQEKVFKLFKRLDTGTEGTGMGLALVKRIVEAHGGHIDLASEGKGRGCTFTFTLPRGKRTAGGTGVSLPL